MSDELDKEEDKGFKVEDKRRFTDAGDAKDAEDVQSRGDGRGLGENPDEAQAEAGAGSSGVSDDSEKQSAELPAINFSTFVISLSTQALMLLGEISDPSMGAGQKDVGVAKQTIDIVAMLAEKTRGNLDVHEAQLLKEVLYDLRMRYVEAVRQK